MWYGSRGYNRWSSGSVKLEKRPNGRCLEQSEIDAIAKARLPSTLVEVTEKAEQNRGAQKVNQSGTRSKHNSATW